MNKNEKIDKLVITQKDSLLLGLTQSQFLALLRKNPQIQVFKHGRLRMVRTIDLLNFMYPPSNDNSRPMESSVNDADVIALAKKMGFEPV